jgi:hypothetical protein
VDAEWPPEHLIEAFVNTDVDELSGLAGRGDFRGIKDRPEIKPMHTLIADNGTLWHKYFL